MGSALEMDNFNGLSHKRRMIRKCSLLVGDVDGKWGLWEMRFGLLEGWGH